MRADLSGIINVERAEALIETLEHYQEQVAHNESSTDTNLSSAQSTSEGAPSEPSSEDEHHSEADFAKASGVGDQQHSGAEVEEQAAPPMEDDDIKAKQEDNEGGNKMVGEVKTVTLSRKKVYRVPLKLRGLGPASSSMSPQRKLAAKKTMADFYAREVAKAETAAARNELEAYIISTREVLEEEDVAAVASADQRGTFQALLTETEDWLYTDGDSDPAPTFRNKLDELKKLGDPIFLRRRERVQLPQAVGAARKLLEAVRHDLASWPATRPWLNVTQLNSALKKVEETGDWLEKEVSKQATVLNTEDPILTSDAVTARAKTVEGIHARLKGIKKPKSASAPKKKAAPENATEDGNIGEDSEVKAKSEEAPGKSASRPDPTTTSEEGQGIRPHLN
eukprot:jgi/Botrbrau1/19862/Bobra.0549s0002.2